MDGGLSRFGDFTNSVFAYNKMNGNIINHKKYKNQCVQAPLTSRKEVKDYISSLKSTRKERTKLTVSPWKSSPLMIA